MAAGGAKTATASTSDKTEDGSSPTVGEEETAKRNPVMELAQWRFIATNLEAEPKAKKDAWNKLIDAVKEAKMGPFYEKLCEEASAPVDHTLLAEMKANNAQRLSTLDDEIKDAEGNLGESEVRAALLRKAEYLCEIGDKDGAVSAFRRTFEKTVGIGNRIDLIFHQIRLGLFYMDHPLISANLSKAHDLMEQGGDWDRRNRLKLYEGLYKLAIRDFKAASDLFLEAVPTFSSYELMTYEQLIVYTVVACMLALERPQLRDNVLKSAEIQEQLNGNGRTEFPMLNLYLQSFYDCQYDRFFSCLAEVEDKVLKFDRYLGPHYAYYSRVMRIKGYEQFLTPYKTVKLAAMASDFGVSQAFVDQELHRLIATGAIHARIDAVRGVIETNRPDSKNELYKTTIRDGDVLLNRIQKLGRVINE